MRLLSPHSVLLRFLVFVGLPCLLQGAEPAAVLPPTAPTAKSSKPAGPNCRMAALLNGKLFKLVDGKYEPYAIDYNKVAYFAIYFSASWCHPCIQFTPRLLTFYTTYHAQHPNFEIILVHHTERSPAAMLQYLKSSSKKANVNATFPVMGFENTPPDKKDIKVHTTQAIPSLIILDGNENVLARSYDGNKYIGPDKPFQTLKDLLGIKEVAPLPPAAPTPTAPVAAGAKPVGAK